jgi:hypothetical protein
LVDQIAVGGVDLDTIEARRQRIAGGALIIVEDARDLVQPQRPRLGIRLLAGIGVRLARSRRDRGRDRSLPVQIIGMNDTAHVPELGEDAPAGPVHRPGDRLPGLHLGGGPQPGAKGQPSPSRLIPVASEMISPAEARCA